MPEHLVGDAVEVLLELPREARLADAGDADDRDEVRLSLLRRAVEVLLDEAQLARAADERRLELAATRARRRESTVTRSARKSESGSALPFSSCSPAGS